VATGCDIGTGPTASITHSGDSVWFNIICRDSAPRARALGALPGCAARRRTIRRTWSATEEEPGPDSQCRFSFFDFQYLVPEISAWAIRPLFVSW
jgi:hypothetical protein